MKHVIIIGGGVIGLCTAYFLTKEGYQVSIIDKSKINSGASYINAGYVSPSHFISLASPETVKKGLHYLTKKDAPLYIQPRWDVSFFKWAYYFYKSATPQKVKKAIPVIKEISLLSKNLYQQIKNSNDAGAFQWETKGLLHLYKSQQEADNEFEVSKIAEKEGLDVKIIDKKELLSLEPAIHESIKGAFWYKCDAHSTPNEFMDNLGAYLKKQGVHFILNEEVISVNSHKNKITTLQTANGSYSADEIVLATGSWTESLGNSLKLKLPVQAGKGYSINSTDSFGIKYPAVLMDAKVAVTPMKGFTRFAGTMEFSGNNHLIKPARVKAIAKAASGYYKNISLKDTDLQNAKCGLRPVTPDGLPYIGRTAKFNNLVIAAGHAMMGWSMAPATGKLVKEIITAEKPGLNLEPFNPDRFS